MAPFGLDEFAAAPEVTHRSSREDQLAMLAASEIGFTQVYDGLFTDLAPVEGITAEIITIPRPEDNDIRQFVHRPTDVTGQLPIHGGGMTIMSPGSARPTLGCAMS